jgi:ribonuclease-3
MARGPRLDTLFERLGRPVAPMLIEAALTHPGGASPARPDYERLEFLGDRVLGLIVAEALLARFPDEPEGLLAPRLAALVSSEACAQAAQTIGLGAHLRLDRGDARSGGRKRVGALGDAMEAVVAAVYLDGGLDAAREVVLRLWTPMIEAQGAQAPRDPKSALQEWAEGRGLPKPEYAVVARQGPDHAPRFEIEARLATGAAARAAASSKREAEKAAAAALLASLHD